MPVESLRVGRDITADDRRAAVLRSALACIAAQGADSVRLKDVSREAGVSVGLLQHYFESRDELVSLAFRQASEDLLAGWRDALAEDLDPWQRLVVLVDHLVERESLRDRCLVWVEFATAAARHAAAREGFTSVYQRWAEIVSAAVHDGVAHELFRPLLDPDLTVELILEQIDGAILSVASGIDRVDGAEMRTSILTLAATLLGYEGAIPG